MRSYLFYFYLTVFVTVAGVFFPGCTLKKTQSPSAPAVDQLVAAQRPVSCYYFFTEAQLHRKKGDLEGAIRYLQQAIDLDRESTYLKRELASIYLERKDHENALGVLENILGENPGDVETLILYGKLNLGLKRMEKAKGAFEKVISTDPKRENVYTVLGRIYMAEGDLDNAFRVFRQLVHHFPASFVGHFFLGRIYAKQGDREKAEKAFEKTLKLEPALLEPRFELIDLLRSEESGGDGDVEKDEKVIRLYRDILDENPRNIRAAIELGLFYDEIGRAADAEKILKPLGRRSKTENVVLSSVIRQYFEKQKYGG